MTEETEMKCPICDKTVTKVREITEDNDKETPCENEFYKHTGKQLIKILEPKSASDDNANRDNG